MTLLTTSAWPKGEETFGAIPHFSIETFLLIFFLMGLVIAVILFVQWSSKRNKK
jgi:hypothetical protein